MKQTLRQCSLFRIFNLGYFGNQHLWKRVRGDHVPSLVLLGLNPSDRPNGKKEDGFLTGAHIVLSGRSLCMVFNKDWWMEGKSFMAVSNGQRHMNKG